MVSSRTSEMRQFGRRGRGSREVFARRLRITNYLSQKGTMPGADASSDLPRARLISAVAYHRFSQTFLDFLQEI